MQVPYDIMKGELEMLFLAYWKMDTQDLEDYDETLKRVKKKLFNAYDVQIKKN